MTDKEIIRALECIQPRILTEKERMAIENALDLINHQQAEIDNLKAERNVMLEDLQFRANQVIEQQAEIERLKNEVIAKEYEYNDVLEQRNSVEYNLELLKQERSVVIAEAIKEFAQSLKAKCDYYNDYYSLDYGRMIDKIAEEIDNLVKEMAGEDK